MGDAMARIDGELLGAIETLGARGEDLTHPVGRDGEKGHIGKSRHSLAPPAGDVGDEDVAAEVELGLVEEDPVLGAIPVVTSKMPLETCAEGGRDSRVADGRARARIEDVVAISPTWSDERARRSS